MGFVYMYVCASCEWLVCSEARMGVGFLGTGVIDSCEPSCGFCDLNLDPLQE